PPAPSERDEPQRWLVAIPLLTLAIRIALHLVTWFRRDYHHDDFYIAYVTWLRSVGAKPGVDFQVFLYNPLEEFLWPLFKLFPESFLPLEIAKGLILAAAACLLYTVYRLARRAGASPAWSLAAGSLVAWQKDFGLRVSDVRSDPFAILCVLWSLLFVL